MGSRWPGSQVNSQQSALQPILDFLLPLQVDADLSEEPSPESAGVWPRRTLPRWATVTRGWGGAPLLSGSCRSASPGRTLLLSSRPTSTRSLHAHGRSPILQRARKETHRQMGTSGPRPCPRIRKSKTQKLEL